MKVKAQLLAVILTSLLSFSVFAQNENEILEDSLFNVSETKVHFDMAFSLKSQNYFRGLLPSKSPTLSTNAGVIWKNWIVAMYGGVGMDGVYQETDFILLYSLPRINFRLEYWYNFTQGITDIQEPSGLFDFNPKTTRGLLDFAVNAALDKKKHWNIMSSTLLFGRDTNFKEEEVDGETTLVRTDQRYSQYLELEYSWYAENYKFQAFLGGSFSWTNFSGPQFYGDRPGINNIGASATREFVINNQLKLPVKASATMNPLAERAYLIISVNLIQLSKL
ncbi:hypothetical protein AAGF08_14720 [Algoriphagus sp. SE2]|uniref:hypothetical protein n=1 Tax=Algoriphagus sp. SE2 TaxID=3141536 RepID=UPI0031CCFFB0